MQCRGSRRAFTTAGEESGLMPGYGMKRGSRTVLFLVAHALRRSQFSPSESLLRPSLRFRSVFPVENFTMRKFSTGNRRENAESRRDGRTLMRKGKIVRFVNTISSDGIAYLLLHLFQLMGQDFHVAADTHPNFCIRHSDYTVFTDGYYSSTHTQNFWRKTFISSETVLSSNLA